jgi:hypothetical protein
VQIREQIQAECRTQRGRSSAGATRAGNFTELPTTLRPRLCINHVMLLTA